MQAVQLYAPYGAVRYNQGTVPTTYNYTGQRLDSETGLLYYGFRYYDPVVGQFVRADTVEGNLLGMDSYAYVKGNPETHNDPTGHGDPWLIYIVAWYESFHQGQTILSDTPGSHALPVPGTRDEPDIANTNSHVIWDAKTSGDIQSPSFFDMGVGWPSDDYVRTGSRRVQRDAQLVGPPWTPGTFGNDPQLRAYFNDFCGGIGGTCIVNFGQLQLAIRIRSIVGMTPISGIIEYRVTRYGRPLPVPVPVPVFFPYQQLRLFSQNSDDGSAPRPQSPWPPPWPRPVPQLPFSYPIWPVQYSFNNGLDLNGFNDFNLGVGIASGAVLPQPRCRCM